MLSGQMLIDCNKIATAGTQRHNKHLLNAMSITCLLFLAAAATVLPLGQYVTSKRTRLTSLVALLYNCRTISPTS